jgi:hypothetical protein
MCTRQVDSMPGRAVATNKVVNRNAKPAASRRVPGQVVGWTGGCQSPRLTGGVYALTNLLRQVVCRDFPRQRESRDGLPLQARRATSEVLSWDRTVDEGSAGMIAVIEA